MHNSFQTEVLRNECKKNYLSRMDVNMIAENFRTHTRELVELIERFDPASFNQRPADNGWTAGEVTEHLLLFDIHLNRVLGSIDKPVGRDPLAKATEYTPRITNHENKIQAPPPLVPSGTAHMPSSMAEKILSERNKILKAMADKDMTLISTQYPHRFFGEMTAMEWINFCDMHTLRHMPQLAALKE